MFNRQSATKDGRQSWCKECRRAYSHGVKDPMPPKVKSGAPVNWSIPKTFAQAVRMARDSAGLTRGQLAHDVQVSVASIENIEYQIASPSLKVVRRLLTRLNMPPETVLLP